MSSISEANSQAETPGGGRWREALRPTPRFRKQLVRGIIVILAFVAFLAVLTSLFGITILQYTLAGFRLSSIVIVAAIGLTLIYGIRGFANFAYGDLMTLGAYVALFINLNAALSLIWGAIVSFIALAVVGVLLEILIFARLEGRGPVAPIVASVGVGLIIQNGIRALATTKQWIYRVPATQEIPIVPGLGLSWISDFATVTVGLSFMLAVHILLAYTSLGKSMRATADNLELAKATGIDTKRVTYAAWAVSCSFASTAGILLGVIGVVSPTRGFEVLLLVFAAVIVGGIGSPYGAVLGGLVIGLSQEMSVPLLLWLGRSDVLGKTIGLNNSGAYKVAIPFIVLIAVLILRPWGIAGRRPAFARRVFLAERLTGALRRRTPPAKKAEGDQGV